MTEIKRDTHGIIGQPDDKYMFGIEGGDSMNWQAHELFLRKSNDLELYCWWPKEYTRMFESKEHPGLYVRHPNIHQSIYGWASYCEGNWRGVESRDQMTGKLCFFAKAKAKAPLWRSFKQHCKRFMLFANNTIHNGDDPDWYKGKAWDRGFTMIVPKKKYKLPDLTGPDIWALYIRGFRAWPLYPVLIALDLHLLLTAITKYFKSDTDIISFTLKVITAQEIMPTPLGWIAAKVSSSENILGRLKAYWCGWRSQPGMYELYKPYVKKYWR